MIGLFLTTFNQWEDTQLTLDSLFQNTTAPFKLVLVDNASTDGTISHARKDGIPVIENEKPTPLATALNQGINYFLSRPDIRYIGWIHNDMLFYKHWLSRLVQELDADPSIGKLAPDSFHLYGPHDAAIQAESFMVQNKENRRSGNACPWVMPKAVIRKIGRFDEQFVGCGGYEDWDFNNRILHAGYRVMITKGSVVWHPAMGTRKNHDEAEAARMNLGYYNQKWGRTSPKV